MTKGLAETTEAESEEELEIKLADSHCISCKGLISTEGLKGKILQEYLHYRYSGGEKCFPCHPGVPEKPMNFYEWNLGV